MNILLLAILFVSSLAHAHTSENIDSHNRTRALETLDAIKEQRSWIHQIKKDREQTSKLLYSGPTKNGKPHGEGLVKYANGRVYVGAFLEGKRSGPGFMKFEKSSNISSFEGNWKDDKPNGEGTITYADGQIIQGYWEDGTIKKSNAS